MGRDGRPLARKLKNGKSPSRTCAICRLRNGVRGPEHPPSVLPHSTRCCSPSAQHSHKILQPVHSVCQQWRLVRMNGGEPRMSSLRDQQQFRNRLCRQGALGHWQATRGHRRIVRSGHQPGSRCRLRYGRERALPGGPRTPSHGHRFRRSHYPVSPNTSPGAHSNGH